MENKGKIANMGISKITKVRINVFADAITENTLCSGVTPYIL
jgi:hypothetical protein